MLESVMVWFVYARPSSIQKLTSLIIFSNQANEWMILNRIVKITKMATNVNIGCTHAIEYCSVRIKLSEDELWWSITDVMGSL